jgi:hypothetical protein
MTDGAGGEAVEAAFAPAAAVWSLADQGQRAAAWRTGLALLRRRPRDRLLLGLLARLAAPGEAAALRQALAAGDAEARYLAETPPPDASPALRAKLVTWLLDLGEPAAALSYCEPLPHPALSMASARVLRALGRLEEAALAYRRVLATAPDQREARCLAPALNGEAPGLAAAEGLAAVPFLRLASPLDPSAHAGLREALLALLPRFGPAQVHAVADAPDSRDPARSARVLFRLPQEVAALRRWLLAEQTRLLATLLPDPPAVGDLELQATLSGTGDRYAPHRDSGDRSTGRRSLTLVYYLHRRPRAFRGGALRLYDSDLSSGHWLAGGYTRIEPDDGTLLLFPAAAWHEIEPVTDCAEPVNGRLTVNGWFRTAPPR